MKLTTKLWLPPPNNAGNSPVRKDKKERGLTVVYDREFPFLDMKMCWDEESGEMRFSVFQKPNQALKYVDKNSMHRTTTFKSIANGVFTLLARLTSKITAIQNARIDDIYPDHAEALFTVDLAPPMDFPTFNKPWQDDEKQKNKPMKSKRSEWDQQSVYFVIGHINFSLQAEIPLLIKRLHKNFK
eukprot:14048642-Ditylum_brightwellii.AAC.1